jgi:hypothetical protein
MPPQLFVPTPLHLQDVTVATSSTPSDTESDEPSTPEYRAIMEDMLEFDVVDTDESSSDEEIINVIPMRSKPTFKFEPSALAARLPSFVEDLKTANEKLKDAGDLSVEVDDDYEGPHIEMALGLGVLEEKADSSEEEDEVTIAPGIQELS